MKNIKIIIAALIVTVIIALGYFLYGKLDLSTEPTSNEQPQRPAAQTPDDTVNTDPLPANNPTPSPPQGDPQVPSQTTPDPNAAPTMTLKEYRDRLANDEEFTLAIIKYRVDNDPQAKKHMEAFGAAMVTVEFHGKVIDDMGQSIRGVEIEYKVGYPYGYGYSDTVTIMTDSDGRFVIRQQANSILIKRVVKENYQVSNRSIINKSFRNRTEKGSESWQPYISATPFQISIEPSVIENPNLSR